MKLLENTEKLNKPVKIKNAVILAAGYSSRFVPVCFDMPKGLLPVHGETLIERQIKQLREVGIDDITIITGAYREQFDFLYEKYSIVLIFNPDFANKNNFASIYAARDVLGNTMISSSDLYFPRNIFQGMSEHSYYASVFAKGKTNQRSLTLDADDRIIGTTYGGADTWITFGGQAFFEKEFSQKLINYMRPVYDNPEYANKYWVDFQDAHLDDLPMFIKRLYAGDIVEFNTLESLWTFDKDFCAANVSPTMLYIVKKLDAKNERELTEWHAIKDKNAAIGCSFLYNNNRYNYFCTNKKLIKL